MAATLVDLTTRGLLPQRVAHNDAKLDNVMIDDDTGERRYALVKDAGTAARVADCVRGFCAELGVQNLEIRSDLEPPRTDPVSGKLRRVCALPAAQRAG